MQLVQWSCTKVDRKYSQGNKERLWNYRIVVTQKVLFGSHWLWPFLTPPSNSPLIVLFSLSQCKQALLKITYPLYHTPQFLNLSLLVLETSTNGNIYHLFTRYILLHSFENHLTIGSPIKWCTFFINYIFLCSGEGLTFGGRKWVPKLLHYILQMQHHVLGNNLTVVST